MECYSVFQKKKIPPHVTIWMNFEVMTLNERRPSQKDKHYMIPLRWGIRTVKVRERRVEWWLPRAGGEGNGELLFKSYEVCYVRWLSSRDLLCNILPILSKTVFIVHLKTILPKLTKSSLRNGRELKLTAFKMPMDTFNISLVQKFLKDSNCIS